MTKIFWGGLLTFLLPMFISGCLSAVGSDTTSSLSPTSSPGQSLPRTCPNGHSDLRDTPVLYGLLNMTPELRQQIDRHEVVMGGCVLMPGYSPASLLICSHCQYSYNPVIAEWERLSNDVQSFERPLAPILGCFPVPSPQPPSQLTYRQVIKDGQLKLESVSFQTSDPLVTVTKRIDRYLNENAVIVTSSGSADDRVYREQVGVVGDWAMKITIMVFKETGDVHVSVELSSNHAGISS
jgi:hypothetical protein